MLNINREQIIQKFENQYPSYKLVNEGDNFYVDIVFSKVKGYDKLSSYAKKIFERMYKKHNAAQGLDNKIRWIPKSVKEHKDHLEVHFNGKDWLHWLPNGEWY